MKDKQKKRNIILDTLALTGKNIGGILLIVIIFYIFLSLVSAGIVILSGKVSGDNKSLLSVLSIVSVLGIVAIGTLVQSFTNAAAIKYVYEKKHGNKITAIKAILASLKKFFSILMAAIIIALISGIAGFIATIIYGVVSLYVGADAMIFSILLGGVTGIIAIILTSFIIPTIMIEDKQVFVAFRDSLKLIFSSQGQVILKVLGLIVVSLIVITLSYLLELIPDIGFIMTYVVILIGQLVLVFTEIGKIIIFEDYR